MTNIECPKCGKLVDVDSATVKKESRGIDLAVRCPHCGTDFLLARVAEVRQKLQVAQYGRTKDGVRVRLQ